MRRLTALILDDEIHAINYLETLLLDHTPIIDLVAATQDPMEAVQLIREKKPDLVFLDVNMPRISGFDMLRLFPERPFHLIFVTAHKRHAYYAIKLKPDDYLLKPVDPSELDSAIQRLAEKFNVSFPEMDDKNKYLIRNRNDILFVERKDIVKIVAEGSYSNVYTADGKIHLVSRNLSYITEELDDDRFFRAHRSVLINLEQVRRFSKETRTLYFHDGSEVRLAKRKTELYLQRMLGTEEHDSHRPNPDL
jgi:two-component system LytT family response regulator